MLDQQYSKDQNLSKEDNPQQLELPDPGLSERLDAKFKQAAERFRAPKQDPEAFAQAHLQFSRLCIAAAKRAKQQTGEG